MTDTESEAALAPSEWADRLFPTTVSGSGRVSLHADRWRHEVAAVLHGWTEHEHHAGAPMALSRDDYDLAILAVEDAIPHEPALSPFKGCAV